MSKLKFIHVRFRQQDTISPKGGCTIAYTVNGNSLNYAWAECCESDIFSRKMGRIKAAGRLKSEKLSKVKAYNGELNSEIVNNLRNEYINYKSGFTANAINLV